jgi:hypothetical protein
MKVLQDQECKCDIITVSSFMNQKKYMHSKNIMSQNIVVYMEQM